MPGGGDVGDVAVLMGDTGGGAAGGGGAAVVGGGKLGDVLMWPPDDIEAPSWLRGGKDGGSFLLGRGGPLDGIVDTLGKGGAACFIGGGGSLSC